MTSTFPSIVEQKVRVLSGDATALSSKACQHMGINERTLLGLTMIFFTEPKFRQFVTKAYPNMSVRDMISDAGLKQVHSKVCESAAANNLHHGMFAFLDTLQFNPHVNILHAEIRPAVRDGFLALHGELATYMTTTADGISAMDRDLVSEHDKMRTLCDSFQYEAPAIAPECSISHMDVGRHVFPLAFALNVDPNIENYKQLFSELMHKSVGEIMVDRENRVLKMIEHVYPSDHVMSDTAKEVFRTYRVSSGHTLGKHVAEDMVVSPELETQDVPQSVPVQSFHKFAQMLDLGETKMANINATQIENIMKRREADAQKQAKLARDNAPLVFSDSELDTLDARVYSTKFVNMENM